MPVAILGQLAFCAFANLYIPLAGVLWFQICKRTGHWPLRGPQNPQFAHPPHDSLVYGNVDPDPL